MRGKGYFWEICLHFICRIIFDHYIIMTLPRKQKDLKDNTMTHPQVKRRYWKHWQRRRLRKYPGKTSGIQMSWAVHMYMHAMQDLYHFGSSYTLSNGSVIINLKFSKHTWKPPLCTHYSWHIRRTAHLGSGQFGGVEKAIWKHKRGVQEVAVKSLPISSLETDKVKLLQEAAIMAQFRHPNVVRLLGVVTSGEPVSHSHTSASPWPPLFTMQRHHFFELSQFTVSLFNAIQTMLVLEYLPKEDLRKCLVKMGRRYVFISRLHVSKEEWVNVIIPTSSIKSQHHSSRCSPSSPELLSAGGPWDALPLQQRIYTQGPGCKKHLCHPRWCL